MLDNRRFPKNDVLDKYISWIWARYEVIVYVYEVFKFQKQPLEVFCKKGVLRNFTKFTGKHQCKSLIFNKVTGLRPATLLKTRLLHRCSPVNFVKFLRTPILTERLRWLLLIVGEDFF